MKRLMSVAVLANVALAAYSCLGAEAEKDVPWRAQSEIARRGAMVERVEGIQEATDAQSAIAAAMQPPADDSYKWLFTLVVTRNCQWCELARKDFEADLKLKAWVDTKDYAKSWAHWQVAQIEDQSQAWRWKDFRPSRFPALIVQPPVNGSWGDPHTIVFAQQGYLKPVDLDAALRKAIQLYATKTYPRRLTWDSVASVGNALRGVPNLASGGGLRQSRSAEPTGGWTPPVTPPSPLPALPQPLPPNPSLYPNVPPQVPPQQIPQPQPDLGTLLSQLIAGLLGGPAFANFLLLAILAWQVYRGFAKREGIPLLLDDATAAQLVQLLQSLPRPTPQQPVTPTARNVA